MPVSRRHHTERMQAKDRRIEQAIAETEAARIEARANAEALRLVALELSTAKDVIASHLTAAGHPSTVLHDVHAFAEALREALADAGVDLRLELARMEGAGL